MRLVRALVRGIVLVLTATLTGFGLAMWDGPLWGKVAIVLLAALGFVVIDVRLNR